MGTTKYNESELLLWRRDGNRREMDQAVENDGKFPALILALKARIRTR